jgi:hypothetical protein
MNLYKINNRLHTFNIHWHRLNILIPKGRNRKIEKRDGTKERLKPSRAPCGVM